MLTPTIHLNGTSGEDLLEQYTKAHDAVRKAIDALYEARPNGRDYYVQGPTALGYAQREHEARIAALRKVQEDLVAIGESIQDQIDARDAARGRR
jgi:hypothetical protein